MNEHLHPIFRDALAPFSPIDADRIKVGQELRKAANDPHAITRKSTGSGISASTTLHCSCGWSFTAYESDDYMSTKLSRAEREHMDGGAGLARAVNDRRERNPN